DSRPGSTPWRRTGSPACAPTCRGRSPRPRTGPRCWWPPGCATRGPVPSSSICRPPRPTGPAPTSPPPSPAPASRSPRSWTPTTAPPSTASSTPTTRRASTAAPTCSCWRPTRSTRRCVRPEPPSLRPRGRPPDARRPPRGPRSGGAGRPSWAVPGSGAVQPGRVRAEAPVLVQRADRREVLGVQGEVEHVDVLPDPRRRHGLRDHDVAELEVPAQHHLGRGALVLARDGDDRRDLQQALALAQRRPRLRGDAPLRVVLTRRVLL